MDFKLKGFRDFLPAEARRRYFVIDVVRSVAESFGFEPIDTPTLEYSNTLFGFGGTDKEVYAFKDHGDRDVGLRFDLTIPFARYVSENYNELSFPFKKIHIGEVFRGEKPQKGRFRQFCQADFDIIGVDSFASDVEVIAAITTSLDMILGQDKISVQVNSRSLLSQMIKDTLGSNEDEDKILIALDKLDKIGKEKVIALIHKETGKCAESLLVKLEGDVSGYSEAEHLNKICEFNRACVLSPHIARGLGYYTGVVFETVLKGEEKLGSIASGGRYDNLVSRFGKHDISGVGGSIGVDRLLSASDFKVARETRIFIAVADESYLPYAYKTAFEIRGQTLFIVDVCVKIQKLGKQFQLAAKKNSQFVVVVGEDEVKNNNFTVKNLASGEQKSAQSVTEIISMCTQ